MINVKDKVYEAIHSVCEHASDAYPTNWVQLPAIQYMEEDNKVQEWTDDKEQISYVRYRIDIWDNISTSSMALAIDAVLSQLGLKRTFCQDVDDPSYLKHKVMRYEAILQEIQNGEIYVYHQ